MVLSHQIEEPQLLTIATFTIAIATLTLVLDYSQQYKYKINLYELDCLNEFLPLSWF